MRKFLPLILLLAAAGASAQPANEDAARARADTLLAELSGKAADLYASDEGAAAGAEYRSKEKERLGLDESFRLGEAELGTLITRYRNAPAAAGLPAFLDKRRAELRFWEALRGLDDGLARYQSLASPPRAEALEACRRAAAFIESSLTGDATAPVDPSRHQALEKLAMRVTKRHVDLRARLSVEDAAAPAGEPASVRAPGSADAPPAADGGPTPAQTYAALFDGAAPRRASEADELSSLGALPTAGRDLPPALGLGPQLVSSARIKIQEEFLKADGDKSLDAIDRLAYDAMAELRVEERKSRESSRSDSASREWFERALEELRLIAKNAREAKDSRTAQEKSALLASLYRRLDQIYADGDRSLRPPESEYREAMARYLKGAGGGAAGPEAADATVSLDAALAAFRAHPRDRGTLARMREAFQKAGPELARWERDDPQALYEFLYKAHEAREAVARGTNQDEWGPVFSGFDERLARFVAERAKDPGRPKVSGAPERAVMLAFAESLSFFPATSVAARRAAADERLDQTSGAAAAAAAPVLALVPEAKRAELERERAAALRETDSARRSERVGELVERALVAARANPELAPALDAPRLAFEARRAYEGKVKDASKRLSESPDAREGFARLAKTPPAVRAAALEDMRGTLGTEDAAAFDVLMAASRELRDNLAGVELREAEVHAAHPELGTLMNAQARAVGAALEFIRTGDAPDGTVASVDGPRGRVEARAGPWVFNRDPLGWKEAPLPLGEYLLSVNGRVRGWHEIGPGRKVFRGYDGRLQIVVEGDGAEQVTKYLLDGRFAGSMRPAQAADGEPRLESTDPDHPHVVLLGRGDTSREPHAWIDLSQLDAVTDAGDRRAAIGELARELASYLGSTSPAALESFLLHQLMAPQGKPSLVVQRQRRSPGAEIDLRFEKDGHLRLISMWHDADKPGRLEGTLTLAGPGGKDARRVAQHAYEAGIFESTMDENATETNPLFLQMGTRALTERFVLYGDKLGAMSGEPKRGEFRPHTDVNHFWVDAAGAGLEAVGSIMQEAGAQIRYVAIDPIAAQLGDDRYYNQVMLDSESNHHKTPLAQWLQKQTGQNWAAETWRSMTKEERQVYVDRAASKGLTDRNAAYLEFKNAGTPFERNMELARDAQSEATRTGSRWAQARSWGFTSLAVGAQVGEGLLGSFAVGGMVKGIGDLMPRFGRVLGLGLEAADMADTTQSVAQIPFLLLAADLKNPDSLAILGATLADLEGVGDVVGHAGHIVDAGHGSNPHAANAAPDVRPSGSPTPAATPAPAPSPSPASTARERSAAPRELAADAVAPRSRLTLDADPMAGRDNILTGTFNGTKAVVKLTAAPNEMSNQRRARGELAALGADNVHVPQVYGGGDTDAFLDKAIAAAPDDGGAFAKIGGETLGEFSGRQTVISERLPDGAVSLRDVLAGKAKIDPVDAADLQGLQNAVRGLHQAGLTNALNPGNVFLRQVDGRTHFHLLGWDGARSRTPMGDAFNAVWDGLAGMDLAAERGRGTGGSAPTRRGSQIPADPNRAREIRDAMSRRPPIDNLMRRFLASSERLGLAKNEATPTQGQQGDCATRSLYNHPLAAGIRQAMTYETFHDLVAAVAKARHGIATIDDGLTSTQQRDLAREFGFSINEATDVQTADDLARHLEWELSGTRARIAWSDAGQTEVGYHAVIVEGAFKENGEWKFVVRDPHRPHPYLFSWADLKVLDVTVFDMMPSADRMAAGAEARGADGARNRAMALLGEFDVVAQRGGSATGAAIPIPTPAQLAAAAGKTDASPAASPATPGWAGRYAKPEDASRAVARERELYGQISALATELGVPSDPDNAGAIFKSVQTTSERTNWGKQVWGQAPLDAGPAEMMQGIREGRYDAEYFRKLNLDARKARLLQLVYARESLMSPTAALGGSDPKIGNRSAPARSRLMGEIAALFERE